MHFCLVATDDFDYCIVCFGVFTYCFVVLLFLLWMKLFTSLLILVYDIWVWF